jgi:hypothetical protein
MQGFFMQYYKTVKRNRLDISHARDFNVIINNIKYLESLTPKYRQDIHEYLTLLSHQINPCNKEFYKDGDEFPNPGLMDHDFFNSIVLRLDEIYLELVQGK